MATIVAMTTSPAIAARSTVHLAAYLIALEERDPMNVSSEATTRPVRRASKRRRREDAGTWPVGIGDEAFIEDYLYDWDPRRAAAADVVACEAPPYLSGLWCNWGAHKAKYWPFYYAASTAFQIAGVLLSLRRNPRRSNWPLWMRRSSSIPAMVIAAVLNHLKPNIGPMRSFTPR